MRKFCLQNCKLNYTHRSPTHCNTHTHSMPAAIVSSMLRVRHATMAAMIAANRRAFPKCMAYAPSRTNILGKAIAVKTATGTYFN